MPTGGDEASAAAPGSLFRIADLPIETQREILSHVSQPRQLFPADQTLNSVAPVLAKRSHLRRSCLQTVS